MALGAGAIEQPLGFGIGEERGDLRGYVGSGERLRIGSEFRDQPVEQEISVRLGKIGTARFMLALDQLLPPGAVQSKEGIVVDAVAGRAVLANHLPNGPVRPDHLRARRSSSDLSGGGHRDQPPCARQGGEWSKHDFTLSPAVRCSSRNSCTRCHKDEGGSTAYSMSSGYCPGTRCAGCPGTYRRCRRPGSPVPSHVRAGVNCPCYSLCK